MEKKYIKLVKYSTAFATRESGAKLSKNIKDIYSKLRDKESLVIDMNGVEAISYSFTDEFVKGLLVLAENNRKVNDRYFYFTGIKNEISEVFSSVLARRNYQLVDRQKAVKLPNQNEVELTSLK